MVKRQNLRLVFSFYLALEVARGAYFFENFCHKVFFGMYLPLALKVYNEISIGSSGFMVVDTIKEHLLGLSQSNIYSPWPSFLNEGQGEYNTCRGEQSQILTYFPQQMFLIIYVGYINYKPRIL